MHLLNRTIFLLTAFLATNSGLNAQSTNLGFGTTKETNVGSAWSSNSVNATIFRKNSLVTYKNTQYIGYYDADQNLVLGKRTLGSQEWNIKKTPYKGNTKDAHNSISLMIDGAGFLHVAWDHHNDSLRYAKSISPGTLDLTEKLEMTGQKEDNVTYPEFYKLPNGNLLFFYRYGVSGNGNLVINKYDLRTGKWKQIQSNLIDGEGERNAYWQVCVDKRGTIHVSWVWRETWDVESNHDLCYARSNDEGLSWENSKGEEYKLPINIETAEIAYDIPQNSELINQTSMSTDDEGNPVIVTYWKSNEIPQFQIVYLKNNTWIQETVSKRKAPFSLSGGGTKRIPISRPQIAITKFKNRQLTLVIFRDIERGNKPSVLYDKNFPSGNWMVLDLSPNDLGLWEPSYDTELWKDKSQLSLFLQKVEQIDGEGLSLKKPSIVKVLDWNFD